MKTVAIIVCIATTFSLSPACKAQQDSDSADAAQGILERRGDRGHQLNMVYPAGAFMPNGGPIIDLSRAPYNAKGAGGPAHADHNTKAFISVYDFIMGELDKYGDMGQKVTQPSSTACSYIIYFPKRHYVLNRTVHVPAHIKVVDFMFSRISGRTAFRVRQDAPDPIHFRDLCKSGRRSRVLIEQDCLRTVYTELVPGRFGNPGNHPGAKAFLCSTSLSRADQDYGTNNLDLFWRWGNDEYREHLFHIGDNCRVVLLGYKTEGGGVGFDIAGSSKLEILGGVHTNHGRPLWYTRAYPYIRTNGADVSIITRFMQSDKTYETYVEDAGKGTVRSFSASDFPALGTNSSVERITPLYLGPGSPKK